MRRESVLYHALIIFTVTVGIMVAPGITQAQTAEQRQALAHEQLKAVLADTGITVPAKALPAISSHRSVTVRKDAPAGAAPNALTTQEPASFGLLSVVRSKIVPGGVQRPRSLALSLNHVLAVGVDAQSQLRWWSVLADPRILRAESRGANNEMTAQILYRSQPEFLIEHPNDPQITELRVYHPTWTGEQFRLELLWTLPL